MWFDALTLILFKLATAVGRKNRSAPSMPKRSSGRPDAEDSEGHDRAFQAMKEDADKPLKPKRRSKSKDRGEDNEDDELEEGSFHNLAEDMDKPRSRSAGRKPKGSKRRSHKETSGEDDDDDYEEFGGDDTTEQKLKGDDDAPGSSGAPRKSWRQRRADNRARERSMGSDSSDLSGDADPRGTIDRAPSSAGRRPARRTMIRRSNSERWRKNVDSDTSGLIESDAITRRAKASLANAELSRSAHTMRRYHSGGLHGMTGGLDRRTYHGDRQQGGFERRARKKSSDQLGTASYHGLNDDYDESGRSQRTLDSIEDLEDFERIDFQTPGMVDIEDEIWELMQRANPEDTVHLNRRVHRQREKMAYDQNMPLMTRQALMTRQNSSQVMRGRVDASNIDRRRLLIRNDSNASMGSTDELSYSQHRARYSTTPGRRAPPRSRSSGLAAMAAQSMARAYEQQQQQQDRDGDARRKLFRNKSTNMDSFKQYLNKPNKVAQLSRRAPGSGGDEEIGSNSMRGPSSGGAERRRPVQRAKSTTALRRPVRTDMRRSPRRAENTVPTSIDTKGGKDDVPGLKSPSSKDDDSINSEDSESSSVESMEGDKSPRKAYRKPSKAAAVLAPPKKSPPIKSPKSKKRDLKRKSHRRKLHALLYETKMGVTMKDLHKQVKKADDRDTPAPLMITAP